MLHFECLHATEPETLLLLQQITLSCLPIGIAAAAFGAAVVRRKSLVLCPAVGPLTGAPAGVLPLDVRPFAAGFVTADADLRFAGCFCT